MHKSVKNGQLKKRAFYGRIDIYLQLYHRRFFVMPREYCHIEEYEKESYAFGKKEKH